MKYLRNFFVLALLLAFAGTAVSQQKKDDPKKNLRNGPAVVLAFKSVVSKPSESTVRVAADGKDVAFGAIVEADGWIITKWSEIEDRKKITCTLKDGKTLEAKVIGVSEEFDLALLKVDAKGLKPVEWRPSKEVAVGKWVASVGPSDTPIGVGVVSVARRLLKPGDQPPKTAPGPNTAYLGVTLAAAMGGARIVGVSPKSPAQRAKLMVDDIVFEAAGRKIIDQETLINTIQRLTAGDEVLLKVKRGEEELEIRAKLDRYPKDLLRALINPQETMGAALSKRRGGFPAIIQHDTGLSPNEQGGPLVDLDGKTVGINISRAGRTETYAIPADDIKALLPKLKAGTLIAAKKDDVKKDEAKIKTLPKNPSELLRVAAKLDKNDQFSKSRPNRFAKIHEVKLKARETIIIDMDSTELDAYLIVEDDMGTKLAEDDDGGGFPNARLIFRAPVDGTYRIIATTREPNTTGGYTLTVRKKAEK